MELKVVRNLINRLNEENILYCHWKSNQHVADAFKGIDDIDMLINQDEILKLNIILNELGYKRFRLPEKRSYIGIEDYLGFDQEKGIFVHLHLHYQLTLGEKFLKGYQLPYNNTILNRRIFDKENNIYTTSYEDEMWLLLLRLSLKLRHRDFLKLILKKDIFGESTRNEFLWLKENMDLSLFEEETGKLFGKDIISSMVAICKNGLKVRLIFNLGELIKKKLKPFKVHFLFGSTLCRWNREFFRVKQAINNNVFMHAISYRRTPISGGKIIAFLGPDGAGKSTVIREVNKRFQKVIDINELYLGSGDGESSLLRKPLKLSYDFFLKMGILNRKSKRVDNSGQTYRVNEGKKGNFIRQIGQIPWTYTLTRERRKKLIAARRFRNKGYVVITDRYPQTQFIDMSDGPRYYLRPNLKQNFPNRFMSKIEKGCFDTANLVKPDAVIVLQVASEVAYKRKPDEIDLNSHSHLMDTILQLDFGEDTKKIILDANQPLEKVINDATSAVWRCL